MKCCLVAICIGDKYIRTYNLLFRKSQENYAKRHGYDFRVFTDYLAEPRHYDAISFNKILVGKQLEKEGYDLVIFIDADIIINNKAPPIHEECGKLGDKVGVVHQTWPDLPTRIRMQEILGRERLASEYYKVKSGKDIETDHIINTGLIVSKPIHNDFFVDIFNKYSRDSIGHPAGFHYEQSVIGYELQKSEKHFFLDNKWNAIWPNIKFWKHNMLGEKYSLQECVDDNYFVHLAGGIDHIDTIDLKNIH